MAELKKYAQAATVLFPLIDRDAVDFETGATFAAGDVKIIKDEGAAANTTNLPAHEGNGIYSLALTAAELTAARVVVTVIDQTVPKVWEDQAVLVDTYGNASAEHAFDLDTATVDVGLWRGTQPNVLVSGRVDASVGAMAAAVLTAAAIAADAIQAAKIEAGAITSAKFAAGAIDAAAVAADAIGASELAADAVAEIADAVWDELRSGHTAAGSFGRGAQVQHAGTAADGAASSITLDVDAAPFVGSVVLITGGTGAGQARVITLNFATVAVVAPAWVTAPDATSEFVVVPCGPAIMQGFANVAAEGLADVALKRPVSNVEPSATARTLYGAVCALVNRARINASGDLEVYKTDDAAILATFVGTQDAALEPTKELDP